MTDVVISRTLNFCDDLLKSKIQSTCCLIFHISVNKGARGIFF